MGDFPCIPPIVSFTGLIVGTGHSSLRRDLLPGPGAAQLNCCGFVRLSTYVAPGMPNKVPFKGFHPKMAERQDSQFQPNVPFTCTGKVAGLLRHDVMLYPWLGPGQRLYRRPGFLDFSRQGRRRRHHDGTASLYATEATSFLRFRGLPGRARCLFVFDHPWHPPAQSSTLGFGFALDRPPYAARETILP
ncbi:hypothetical protein HRG_000792 [Hirsutella rhossiliensis]|uniref:Uncharacterized protein n=1 Tax=Hirsutella rhossiliensis TaxID=111463 RepID=A0A9P8SNR3_9HYPO|nr:uncharacterized protein HRG_00792 [Hirsutella rhossiliensis]KAH0968150.1 hypothetical protein HRG_00792 [Hirsutella rhossiliensis]